MKDNFLESDFLSGKRVVIFGINRLQSVPTVNHIKQIDKLYNEFTESGIDNIYCISFGDFVLFDMLAPKFSNKIKFIQDSDLLDKFKVLLNKRGNTQYLKDYWQFACVINNSVVEHYLEQPLDKKITVDTKEKIYSNVGPKALLDLMRE
jgi:peroxiredoxin